MKKICVILFVFIAVGVKPVFAEAELEDYTQGVENAWYGQKPITDEDFEKTVKQLENKKNKKKINKTKKQGQGLYKDEETFNPMNEVLSEDLLLLIPLNLVTTDAVDIPVGHYRVVGNKVKGKIYIEFKQAYSTIAKIEATETNNDFEQSTVNFVQLLPYDEKYVKLIYGSTDFNAYTFIPIKDGISSQ